MTTSLKDSNPFSVLASTASASGAAAALSPAIDDVNTTPSTISDDAPEDIEHEEEDTTPEQAKDVEDPFAQEQSKKTKDVESQKKSSDLVMRKLTRSNNKQVKPFVWAVAVTAALGGLIFGYDMGGSGKRVIRISCLVYVNIFLAAHVVSSRFINLI